MSVWYCVPAKRPLAQSTLPMWKAAGYKVAVCVDEADPTGVRPREAPYDSYDLFESILPYPGYTSAVNALVRLVLAEDPACEWIVTGGDDILPDPAHSPEEIARECSKHFEDTAWPKCWHWDPKYRTPQEAIAAGAHAVQKPQALWSADLAKLYSTFGVMQPTGDKWGDRTGPYIERVCGSPWMGREFCLRINQGRGPLWPEYYHMGEDEELQAVSTGLGVLWQRPDLTHYHRHWGRARKDANDMPEFLKRANSGTEWAKYKALFAERQAAGFPGSEPL